MRVQFFLDAFLDLVFELAGGRGDVGGSGRGFGHQEFDAQKQHEHETEQFHGRLDVATAEEGGKPGEGDHAIEHFHGGRSQADEGSPFETAPRAFVDDGQIDRARPECESSSPLMKPVRLAVRMGGSSNMRG